MSRAQTVRLLLKIRKDGPINPYAVAFMLTESHFRGTVFRVCEFVFAMLMLSVGQQKPKVTLGKCQVGLEHWQNLFGYRKMDLLKAVFDDSSNYKVCCQYLQAVGFGNLREAAIRYNGRPSYLYVKLLGANLAEVGRLASRMKLDKWPEVEAGRLGRITSG
jgi:hypothetical protein